MSYRNSAEERRSRRIKIDGDALNTAALANLIMDRRAYLGATLALWAAAPPALVVLEAAVTRSLAC